MTDAGLFKAGDSVSVLTDLFPARIEPLPEGVPAGAKLRAIITDRSLTVAWLAGREGLTPIIGRVDVPLVEADTRRATVAGGDVGTYSVTRGEGCSCGAAGLKNWNPFPGVRLIGSPRYEATITAGSGPARYTRS